MRLLVVGGGAREHAIAWKLAQSPRVDELLVAPGNAGTATLATNLPIDATDIPALLEAAREHRVDLTVVGPEAPLAAGIVDRFQAAQQRIFGPTQRAARIEVSKVFAKELMWRRGIPTADGQVFTSHQEAVAHVRSRELPLVVKAEGLAAGKGVTVAHTPEEALEAIDACMVKRVFGQAGERVIIEECLQGREVSVFAFTDGRHLSPVIAACDYKRAFDGDGGPNTGGMGSYSPPEFWTPSLAQDIEERILRPTLDALAEEGTLFSGVLYGGLMMTPQGPKVLEFNCRLGDPEAQVILPLLETDLVDMLEAVLSGSVGVLDIRWRDQACVGATMAPQGYPGAYRKGLPISGLNDVASDVLVFHAGTAVADGALVTAGGRVLTVVGTGATLEEAREKAYDAIERITFEGAFYRKDIAAAVKVLQ